MTPYIQHLLFDSNESLKTKFRQYDNMRMVSLTLFENLNRLGMTPDNVQLSFDATFDEYKYVMFWFIKTPSIYLTLKIDDNWEIEIRVCEEDNAPLIRCIYLSTQENDCGNDLPRIGHALSEVQEQLMIQKISEIIKIIYRFML